MPKCVINFHGDAGTGRSPHVGKAIVNGVLGMAEAGALAVALGAFSTCNIGRVGLTNFTAGSPTPPGTNTNIDYKGIVYFKDPASPGVKSVNIPGWDNVASPPILKSEGERIADADVATIVAAINTACGTGYTPMWGKIIQVT